MLVPETPAIVRARLKGFKVHSTNGRERGFKVTHRTSRVITEICLVAVVLLCVSAVLAQNSAPAPERRLDETHQLWSSVVDPVLKQTVTSSGQAQNVGITMMVPLHAAFKLRDPQWEHSFADHFSRFAADPSSLPGPIPANTLARLYYLYLASQFIVLAKESGQQDMIPANLPVQVMNEVLRVWVRTPAWQFGGTTFRGGARERVLWKLDHRKVEKSYYRVIIDEEFYVFAIAADLKAYGGSPAQKKDWDPTLNDVLLIAHRVFSQEVVPQPEGGWLLQPGAWSDHPEYQFAGNPDIRSGMRPAPVPGIGEDTSHTLRLPLWLTSLMKANPPGSPDYRFYEDLRSGLEKQFFNRVLVRPSAGLPCYRMNNFMDGHNGVYRWEYGSLGKNNGYGPYQVSGALVLGWWTFLDSDQIRGVYRDMASEFPWPKQCLDAYMGPPPPGGRPDSAYDPNSSSMRLWHLDVKLASQI